MFNLDRTGTSQLKGLAIILVIISHFLQIGYVKLPFFMIDFGGWGVSTFLIISGYGLAKSYTYKGLKDYIKNKLEKIVLPYTIITLIFIIIDKLYLQKVYSYKIILFSLLGINMDIYKGTDPSMWYIPYILFWYLFFYISFKMPLRKIYKIILLFSGAILIYYIKSPNYAIFLWQCYAFAFPFGVLFGLMPSYIKVDNKLLFILALALFGICYKFIERTPDQINIINHSFNSITFCIISFFIFNIIRNMNLKLGLLKKVGDISYQLYLLEMVFLDKYKVLYIYKNKITSIVLYISLIVTLSILYKYGLQFCIKKLTNMRTKSRANTITQ